MEERYYDLVFIVRPATPEDEIKKVLTVIEHTVAEKGGKIEKTEHWGTRKLAYRVAKHREGIYVHQEIRTNHGELIAALFRDGVLDDREDFLDLVFRRRRPHDENQIVITLFHDDLFPFTPGAQPDKIVSTFLPALPDRLVSAGCT